MRDNEIVKAFDCCNNKTLDCDECPCHYKQEKPCLELDNLVFDLINRQKAEIERLQAEVDKQYEIAEANVRAEIASGGTSCHWCEDKVRAEAIKEFAELSIKRICEEVSAPTPSESYIVEKCNQTIDNLVKEMVGENNA